MVYEEDLYISIFDLERYNKYLAIENLDCEDYSYLKEIGAEQDDEEEIGFVDFDDGTSFYLTICSGKFNYYVCPSFYEGDIKLNVQQIHSFARLEDGYKIYHNDNTYIVNIDC